MNKLQYAERDAEALDGNGGYYFRHVLAMTGESLHSKGDIAAELGHRDMMNDRMKRLITEREQRIDTLAAQAASLAAALEYASEYLDDNKLNTVGHGSKAHNEMRAAIANYRNTLTDEDINQ